jgi:hypothetical protein
MFTGIGNPKRALTDNLYGINILQTPQALTKSKNHQGFFFMTRPQLNMQTENLRNVREFYRFLTKEENSLQRYARCMLDPRLIYGYSDIPPITCSLINNENPFISPATNNIKSISGWPEPVSQFFTSKRGLEGDEWIAVDGPSRVRGTFDLDVTFQNVEGDVLQMIFDTWCDYPGLTYTGKLSPYPDMIVEDEIDYDTRIYRIILDRTKRYLVDISATGYCFPVNTSRARLFDMNVGLPYSDQIDEITVRFKAVGAIYHDDILIDDFNKVVEIFNPNMRDENRTQKMSKVEPLYQPLLRALCLPRINIETYEFEWWVDAETYKARLAAHLKLQGIDINLNEGD